MMQFRSVILAATLMLASVPLSAQLVLPNLDPGASVRTRADLERLLQDYEAALSSPAYSEGVKRSIRADAELIRTRLTLGDFRIGDRIALSVQGETELPDTVQVESGPMIALPLFGEISLRGVLRSEITSHLTIELARFIRDPVVRATGLMRLEVQGAVGQPGFYTMPAEVLLGEALMAAGGPAQSAEMDKIRIERGAETVLEGSALQEAIRVGLTLDQLNLQAGDRIVVPQPEPGGAWWSRIGIITGVIGSLTYLIYLFSR